jgi:hypothetical protein
MSGSLKGDQENSISQGANDDTLQKRQPKSKDGLLDVSLVKQDWSTLCLNSNRHTRGGLFVYESKV